MKNKYVVIIQCDVAHNRCSGFSCMKSFYERLNKFKRYGENTRYISFTCGGCSGKGVASKLENLNKNLRREEGLTREDVVVHLASCMTNESHHSDRCPHIEFIKDIVARKGYKDIVEGSYISKNAARKRELGIYKSY